MSEPKVVNVKVAELKKIGYDSLQEWLKDPNHVYVGRDMTWAVKSAHGSKWHNPFKINDYGIEECLKKYEVYILKNTELLKDIKELKGKDLGCWCVPFHGCHAQILLKLANKETEEEKSAKLAKALEEKFPKLEKSTTISSNKLETVLTEPISSYKDKLSNK